MSSAVPPRLGHLLDMLLASDTPVPIDTLAAALGSSRRTVFRDLEEAEDVLSRYHIEIESAAGKGIRLVSAGDQTEKERLARELGMSGAPLPGSRKERSRHLLTLLLSNALIPQKLYYYAGALGVSEATAAAGLDKLTPFLAAYTLTLVRKPGQGVYVRGEERQIRAAFTAALLSGGDERPGVCPAPEVETGVRKALRRFTARLDWMSGDSAASFFAALTVMVERVKKGAVLPEANAAALPSALSRPLFQRELAALLVRELGAIFTLAFNQAEEASVAGMISACRAKLYSPLQSGGAEEGARVEALVWKMIDGFDRRLVPALRTNDELINGLRSHLAPALIRIRDNAHLPDPFKGSLAEQHPELYEKTRDAVRPLEEYLGMSVPAEELSFIAIHFYAAQLALDEKNTVRRIVRAGVVCAAGIGASYMIASQLRRRYQGELEVTICGWNDREAWEKTDVLISTIALDAAPCQVVLVRTPLNEDDYRHISAAIAIHAFVEKEKKPAAGEPHQPLEGRIDRLIELLRETRLLLSRFCAVPVHSACDFRELARFAASTFAREAGAEQVFTALMTREFLVSQVIAELRIVLLHTQTEGVAEPLIALIVPEGGVFTDPHFQHAQSCVLMLLPPDCIPEMTKIMGYISAALIEVPALLDAVRAGDEAHSRAIIELEISETLSRWCAERLK